MSVAVESPPVVLSPGSQPLPPTPKVMSTHQKMEPSLSGGVALIKNNMKVMVESIKKVNAKAELIEEEVEQAKKAYQSRAAKLQPMKDRIIECEEKIRKNEERSKELTRRLMEKEQVLRELKTFNKHLKKITPEEGAVAETQEKLRKYKEIYSQNYKKYQSAREKRSILDQRLEISEIRSQECERKAQQLHVQLEQNKLEDKRKQLGCKKAIDLAYGAEKNIGDIDRAMESVMKRKSNAENRIRFMEDAISKTENDIDNFNYDRRRIEATLTELLVASIKEKEGAEQHK